MQAISLFLFKSIIVSGLLTAWYLIGLRGRRLHQYNRAFLLSTLFASLAVPLVHIQLFSIPAVVSSSLAPVAALVQQGSSSPAALSVVPAGEAGITSWQLIAAIGITATSLVLLIILSARILRVIRMCRRYPVTRINGVRVLLTNLPRAPFTFLNYLFWNNIIPLDDEAGQLIFRHELTHIVQGHTYDKLACQFITCIFWFNPFFWLLQKELSIVHEFIADEHAVTGRDTEAFAIMLLRSYNSGSYLVPQHHFFSSPVSRRLAMLQCAGRPSYASLRRFMVLPLLACAILLFSFSAGSGRAGHIVPAAKKIVILLDPGHGGHDAGMQYAGYTEKEICLQYAQRIQQLAPDYNVAVRLSRAGDDYISLAQRVAMAGNTPADVFISLHIGDEPGSEERKGDFDIYVSGHNSCTTQNLAYSSAVFSAMQQGVLPADPPQWQHVHNRYCRCGDRSAYTRPIASTEKDGLYVLRNATVPAMVMILGNMKNTGSMRLLTTTERRDALCHAILQGIVDGATAQDTRPANAPGQYNSGDNAVNSWLGKGSVNCR